MQNQYIFGYGSLVSKNSTERFLGRGIGAGDFYLCKLAGFKRKWNVAMDNSLDIPGYKVYLDAFTKQRPKIFVVFLNIVPEAHCQVNGILLKVTEKELELFDKRERNYNRILINDKLDIRLEGSCWTFVGKKENEERYKLAELAGTAFIDKSYYNMVDAAFKSWGQDFYSQFVESTCPPSVPFRDLEIVRV